MICRVRQGSIHYEMHGEGRPLVVLHAMGTDHRAMAAWMEPLFRGAQGTGWKRLYVDLPAHGGSEIDGTVRGTEDFLDMLLSFLDETLAGQRFSVAGMSYGGYLAQGIIHHRASQIDGICLVAPNIQLARGERDLPPRIIREKDDALLDSLDPDIRTAFETLFVYQNAENFRSFMEQIQPGRLLANRGFLASGWRKEHYFLPFDPLAGLEQWRQPALVALGKQDSICGFNDQIHLLGGMPNATIAVLDRTGHMIPIERTSLLQSLTADWLSRVNAVL